MSEKDIRKEMIKGVIEEFRGPRYGNDEVISYDPWEEYLISTVIPSSWKKQSSNRSPDEEIVNEQDYNPQADGSTDVLSGSSDNNSMLNPSSQIKSFGLSFIIDSVKPNIDICVTWARYFNDEESKTAKSLNGSVNEWENNNIFWKRKSYGVVKKSVDLEKFKDGNYLRLYDSDDGLIRLYIKFHEDNKHVSIYFRNDLELNPTTNNGFRPETQDCIFQPSIRIILNNGHSVGMKTSMKSSNELDFLYRNKPVLANGHSCSVIWNDIDYYDEFSEFDGLLWPDYNVINKNDLSKFVKSDIRTEFLPLYLINLPLFDLKDEIENLEFKAMELAELSQEELYDNFSKLLESYEKWISSNENEINKLYGAEKISKEEFDFIKSQDGLLDKQYDTLNRLRKGINLIKSEKLAYLAFCFANKTISVQDVWKKNLNDDDKVFSWRPFQIVFMLLNMESIWNDESPDKNILDLLWIPTGGGKTEAYLGIMAFTMALRRLKSYFNLSYEKTGAGVSIISRYTLRLLTVQQFRRTLRMVTAAEYLRVFECDDGSIGWRPKHCQLKNDWIYGSVRFSVGMWVGGAVTPLHLNYNGRGAMDILKGNSSSDAQGNPSQIIKCPVCGAWLYVPEEGLTDDKNHVHIVIKTDMSDDEIRQKLVLLKKEEFIDKIKVFSDYHKERFCTVSFYFNRKVSHEDYTRITKKLKSSFEIASLNEYSVGYFSNRGKLGKRKSNETDFEIWCTNPTPNCDLNHFWREGSPAINEEYEFPDGNFEREIDSPFKENIKIPIPAYLIDEHVYYRCPTVIVSTADKIARLAFEPRAGSLFGNIDYYNEYYGYCRDGLFPRNAASGTTESKFNTTVAPFSAPDLIIQDELHLMNGPLGSLFGIYEVMVNALIKKQNGNPKYIASTATINNAEYQSKMLFSKKVSQFPPYGLDISNSFFVRDSEKNIWDNSNNGRVYMGIYAPGMGAFTHQVRLYCRLLKISQDNHENDNINAYWTLVGYYNTIRELGSALALYRDDMHARIEHISNENNLREIKSGGDSMELSSRIDSTNLPIILDNLERDGLNNPPEYNALFTTSMFGTGVDISHLSAMVMNAQPKTTGDYIQATGRIGRNNGGLIIDLFRSGRPRDLNHYEMFSSYHSRIYREVEPVSVSPFSKGCLNKGLGPSLVAFLRNARDMKIDWTGDDAKVILDEKSKEDIGFYRNYLKTYLINTCFDENKISIILDQLDNLVKKWERIAEYGDQLVFVEYIFKIGKNKKPKKNVVLGDPIHEKSDKLTVFKNAPQSLREVEDTLGFWV